MSKKTTSTDPLIVWLEGVTPTTPFTVEDAKEFYDLIKNAAGVDSKVEVHGTDHRFTRVHVLIRRGANVIDRIIDVV